MINVENIAYKYPKSGEPVFSDFSAQFAPGEITAVTGKNGSGKTTLTKLLAGIIRPSAGRVTIDGLDTAGMNLFEIGQRIGYVFQNPNRQLFCDTVFNEVAYGLHNIGMDETAVPQTVENYLEFFGLSRYRSMFPGKLSLGEKQRLVLAAVLALGTDYLVLDEPTGGLDVRRRREFGDMLVNLRYELDRGIILVSHDAGFITRYADRELVIGR